MARTLVFPTGNEGSIPSCPASMKKLYQVEGQDWCLILGLDEKKRLNMEVSLNKDDFPHTTVILGNITKENLKNMGASILALATELQTNL